MTRIGAPDASISNVECALLVEDAVARMRHDVFNCLAAVRSASYYIQRRVAGSEPWQADPRVEKFFQLIAEQLDAAVARIGTDPKADLPYRRRVRSVDGGECAHAAVAKARSSAPGQQLDAEIASGAARVDPAELALAIETTLGFFASRSESGAITLRSGPSGDGYSVVVEAKSAELVAGSDSAELPRPLAVARRVALSAGGQFRLRHAEGVVRVEFSVSDGAASGVTILLVDDDLAGRATLSALLDLEGYGVRECGSLAEAQAALMTGDEYAVVLLDRKLPDGQGDRLVPSIRAAMPAAKIVLVTGDSLPQAPTGFDASHQKGLDPIALIELVKSLLPVNEAAE